MSTTHPTASKTSHMTVPVTVSEQRAGGELRLSGLAAPYGRESLDIGFYEVIERGAFRDSLGSGTDTLLLWQHDNKQPLARSRAGNLTVTETGNGIEFTATPPNTTLAKDAIELVRSGVVSEMSFGFRVEKDRWETRDGKQIRHVEKAQLFELSLVTDAAYGTATNVANRSKVELKRDIEASVARMRERRRLTPSLEKPLYGPESEGRFSWFRDKMIVAMEERAFSDALDQGLPASRMGTFTTALPSFQHGGLPEARARLAKYGKSSEARDLSTTATAGGNFVLGGAPYFIGELFAVAARAKSVLPRLMRIEPLPEFGMSVAAPRLTSGAGVSVHTDNAAVQETDPAEERINDPVGQIAGLVDVSEQLLERSDPPVADAAIAAELGSALGSELDLQILTGTGATGHLRGLLALAGTTTSVAYTDASPTRDELFAAIMQLAATITTANGSPPDIALMAARRLFWLTIPPAGAAPLKWPDGLTPVGVPSMPTTRGAGTNQDAIVLFDSRELPLLLGPVTIDVFPDPGSGSLTARIVARQYAAVMASRRPEAIGVLEGTGLAAPTWP